MLNCTKTDLDHPNVWWTTFNTREFIAIVSACDFIISVESVVAHLGAAYGKTGIEFFGSTYPANAGWPCYFNVNRDGYPKSYYPFRFAGYIEENQEAMAFTSEDLDTVIERVNTRNFQND
jgi:ADP-heptose:LPS heptosyltransferase